MRKPAPTDYPIHELLRERWSPRAYDPRPIEREKLLSLFEAARWAPSSNNEQPWRFIVAPRQDEAAFNKLHDVLMEGNQRWAQNAGVLVLAVTKRQRKDRPNKNAQHDLGQAVANLTVQATALGLSLRQMGGIHADRAHEVYGIPEDSYQVLNAIAIGYTVDPEDIPEDMRDREYADRSRKPLSEFVFGEWEQPAAVLKTDEEMVE
jgi:nitroreductase